MHTYGTLSHIVIHYVVQSLALSDLQIAIIYSDSLTWRSTFQSTLDILWESLQYVAARSTMQHTLKRRTSHAWHHRHAWHAHAAASAWAAATAACRSKTKETNTKILNICICTCVCVCVCVYACTYVYIYKYVIHRAKSGPSAKALIN